MVQPHRILLAAAITAALAGCGGRTRAEPPLVVGALRIPALALVYLGEHSGCLARTPGPEIVLRDYASGRDALAALQRREVDVAAGFQTPVAIHALEDPSLRILTSLHAATRSTHLVARSDHGVRTAADLRGKRIGAPRRTNAEFLVRTLLAFEGIDPRTVQLVDVEPGQAAAVIAAGRVDAVAVWSPHVDDAAAALPPEVLVRLYSDVYWEASMLVTREPTRAARRAGLRKLVGCVAEAQSRLESAPDGGHALARELFPGEDPRRLALQWDQLTHQLGLQNVLTSAMAQEAEWLGGQDGAPRTPPHFSALFAPEFLGEFAPELVTYVGSR